MPDYLRAVEYLRARGVLIAADLLREAFERDTIAPIADPLPSWSRRGVEVDQIVLHESVTSSRAATVRVLKARGLGVHIIVDRDGSVTQHAPLAEQCAHAGSKHNARSVAVEVVNRYYGSQGSEGEPDIAAPWAHRGWYILPTPVQCEATWGVVKDLCGMLPGLSALFPGATGGHFRWGRLDPSNLNPPGVLAHHRSDHADGLVPEHYCLLRSLGREPGDAYTLTVAAASSGAKTTPIPT